MSSPRSLGARGWPRGSSRHAAFNTSLVLAPQVVAGIGDESEVARILGSVETVICHRVNTPEEVDRARRHHPRHRVLDPVRARPARPATAQRGLQHQFKIDPNHVRALPPGDAYVISRGKAMRVRISQAPRTTAPLPEPTPARQDGTHRAGLPPVLPRELGY